MLVIAAQNKMDHADLFSTCFSTLRKSNDVDEPFIELFVEPADIQGILKLIPTGDKSPRDRQRSRKSRKKVTFDSKLVRVREIPPRPNKSDTEESDSGDEVDTDSESDDDDDEETDSEDSGDESDDTDTDDSDCLNNKMKKFKVTNKSVWHKKTTPPTNKPTSKSKNRTKPKPAKQQTQQKRQRIKYENKVTPARQSTSKPVIQQRRFGRIITTPSRPASSLGVHTNPIDSSGITLRPRSASASMSYSRRNTLSTSSGPRLTTHNSTNEMNTAPLNDRYNIGRAMEERTKLHAWRVATGAASFVTAPCIAPLYAEQVTVTKLV